MPQNISLQKNSVVAVVVILVVLAGGYFWYSSQDGSSSGASVSTVNPELFNPKLKAFYLAKDKIGLRENDLAFLKKPFYLNLKDHTVEIPSVQPTGRPNPFWVP